MATTTTNVVEGAGESDEPFTCYTCNPHLDPLRSQLKEPDFKDLAYQDPFRLWTDPERQFATTDTLTDEHLRRGVEALQANDRTFWAPHPDAIREAWKRADKNERSVTAIVEEWMRQDAEVREEALRTAFALPVRGLAFDAIYIDELAAPEPLPIEFHEYPEEPSSLSSPLSPSPEKEPPFMSDDIRNLFAGFLHSGDKSNKVNTGIYTGALETYNIQPDMLKLVLDEKGRPIAVIAGEQVLPFETIKVSGTLAKGYVEQYAKGRQGRITQIKGERPRQKVSS